MATPSRKEKGRVVTELARRVASLRTDLGLGLRPFAAIISEQTGNPKGKVSHTQISAWERGKEEPSVERLLAMAGLARTAEERAWFWAKAGVTEDLIRDTYREFAADKKRVAKKREIVEIPFARGLSIDVDGRIAVPPGRSLLLPAEQFGSAPFVFALELDKDSGKGVGLLSPGDIAIIDRSPVEPQRFLSSLVLMFFEHRYEYEGVSLSPEQFARLADESKFVSQEDRERQDELLRIRFPESFAKRKRDFEAAFERTNKFMDMSVAKLGWLILQTPGAKLEDNFTHQLSRFELALEQPRPGQVVHSIPLTDWSKGINPLDADVAAHIKRPNHIVGRVVGWMRQSSASPVGGG